MADDSEAAEGNGGQPQAAGTATLFERCKFISETHRHLHDERRRYEVRYFFAILTFYVLSVTAVLSGDVKLPEKYEYIVWVAFLILGGLTAAFLGAIHRTNRRNKGIAVNAEYICLGECPTYTEQVKFLKEQLTYDKETRGGRAISWAWWWQAISILVVAGFAAWVISAASIEKKEHTMNQKNELPDHLSSPA